MPTPIIDWPEGVPSCIMPLSPQGGLRDNRLSFETDSRMPPVERPLSSWAPEVYSVELAPLSVDQFRLFQAWYKGPLRFGVYPFAWQHPITKDLSPWKIVKGDPPYQVKKIGNIPFGSDRRRISLSFSIMSHAGNISPTFIAQEQADLILQEEGGRIIDKDGFKFDG